MNELSIGTYDIPQGCKAIIHDGKITVRKYKKAPVKSDGGLRCKDCKYYDEGKATFSLHWTTMICKKKPKEMSYQMERVMNKYGVNFQLYYAAKSYDKPCEMFELKEEKKNDK